MMLWNYRLKIADRQATVHFLSRYLFFETEALWFNLHFFFPPLSTWWQHRIFLWYRRETKAEKYIWLFKCKFPFAHFLICWFFVLFFIIFKLMIQFNQNNDPNIFNFVDNFEGRVQYLNWFHFYFFFFLSLCVGFLGTSNIPVKWSYLGRKPTRIIFKNCMLLIMMKS